MKRQSGVLLPVFSLPGDYGCGNFGRSAYEWIDILKEGGFSLWQVLPFGVTDGHNSPYMSYSSFGGNLNFVDPEEVYRMGLVSREELEAQRVSDPYLCQYDRLRETRYAFFKKAAGRIQDPAGIRAFFKERPRLGEACRFFALKESNHGLPWREWTVREPLPEDLAAWEFIQYLFHKQWDALHRYASLQGISIMGDLPFYVSYDSFDLWSSPEDFQLDARKDPTAVAGVPPDYFSEEGQLWGNPLYDWGAMEKDGFVRFREKMEYMLTLFDGIRIDHFRAISAYWSVPAGAKSAKEGKWVRGPGERLVDLIREIAGEKLIVAEDLGIIDDDTRALLRYSGFPGMAVFQFGFDGNNLSPHLPHCYGENLVAYTGTHDNNTLLGFLWELDDETRKAALDYLGNPQDGCNAAIRALLMSRAGCVIFPVQDLLGYGADTRVNTPGNAAGNWAYRLTKEQMDSLDLPYWKHLNHIYAR
ncbi:MAG: 4-alpha-glucanotransferase [Clostridia bacterium]|nr:4-alpha-glucanotransferase [Clostridia bacterium]